MAHIADHYSQQHADQNPSRTFNLLHLCPYRYTKNRFKNILRCDFPKGTARGCFILAALFWRAGYLFCCSVLFHCADMP
ncbi:hypothetical protein CAter282_0649 [Collimonas arenae]|uniref:Uncharacterized protein n=1 Tax=Collimonas arenae TaxID=279058 RepID=A0A127QEG7_9BURK|nr:hypothetical protein CAter10_0694 [Collimonas arenae]AMP08457.1 hypothetical protein CAter282_0649 [Collimonas arenae]